MFCCEQKYCYSISFVCYSVIFKNKCHYYYFIQKYKHFHYLLFHMWRLVKNKTNYVLTHHCSFFHFYFITSLSFILIPIVFLSLLIGCIFLRAFHLHSLTLVCLKFSLICVVLLAQNRYIFLVFSFRHLLSYIYFQTLKKLSQ